MELEQYNFKKFQEGLTDILKNPWKKPICIQDSIPTFPVEDTNEDRLMHNLIMLQFINERLLYPYYSTVGYLLLNKMYFLKYILKTYSTKEDFVAMFKGSSRLTSNEIYEAFNGMSPSNASFLLDRIDCPVSVYTRLKESLEKKEETKFVEAIDKCNLSNILPALKYILFVKQQLKEFDSHDPQGNEGTDMSIETIKQKMHYEIETELTEKHGISPNSSLKQNFMSLWDELFELAYNPNELLESFYPPLFYEYCQMKEDGGLNESDIKAFEYVFHQPAFEEQYNENLKLWNDGTLKDMFTKRSEADGPAEEKPQSTPQIEEPAAEEVKEKVNRDEENDSVSSPKTKERWRLQKYLCRDPGLDKDSQLDYCKGFKKSIVEAGDAGDRALTKFIQYLADNKYIDNDKINKNSFAYALTGRGNFRKMKIITVRWHHKKDDTRKVPESVSVLLYISSNLFDSEKGKTYSQLFNVLDAGPNPCIKDGKDQSSAYYDKISEDFEEYFNECFGQFTKDFDKNTPNK